MEGEGRQRRGLGVVVVGRPGRCTVVTCGMEDGVEISVCVSQCCSAPRSALSVSALRTPWWSVSLSPNVHDRPFWSQLIPSEAPTLPRDTAMPMPAGLVVCSLLHGRRPRSHAR